MPRQQLSSHQGSGGCHNCRPPSHQRKAAAAGIAVCCTIRRAALDPFLRSWTIQHGLVRTRRYAFQVAEQASLGTCGLADPLNAGREDGIFSKRSKPSNLREPGSLNSRSADLRNLRAPTFLGLGIPELFFPRKPDISHSSRNEAFESRQSGFLN